MISNHHTCLLITVMPIQDQAGNFPTVTRMLLSKIDISQPGRVSYVYDQYMFHYLVRFLVCITEHQFPWLARMLTIIII